MLTVTVNSMVERVRQKLDLETNTPTTSVVTDTEIIAYLNAGALALYDIVSELAGNEVFAVSASASSPTYSLPSDFYQLVGVDFDGGGGSIQTLRPFTIRERNATFSASNPRYRVRAGAALEFRPTTFASTVTVSTPGEPFVIRTRCSAGSRPAAPADG